MNIIRSLAWKNLNRNRKRTIATMIGIIIAVALICFIIIFIESFQSSMIKSTQQSIGNYHFYIQDILIDEIEEIKQKMKTEPIENIGISQTIGQANYKTQLNYKQLIMIEGYDDTSLNNRGIELIKGRLPINENEIVISNYLVNNANEILDIGTKLELNVQKIKINIEKYANGAEIRSIETEKEEKSIYTITGIIKQTKEEIESPVEYIAITKLDRMLNTRPCKITILLQEPKIANEFYHKLQTTNSNYTIGENSQLLLWQGAEYQSEEIFRIELVGYFAIFIILIVVTCLISNSFQISFLERAKEFGILTSIGTTEKQIRKIILYEGLFYALISITIGIMIGIGGTYIGIAGISKLISNITMNNLELQIEINIYIILFSVILMLIVIFISCIKPIRMSTKIAPIEVIRQNNEIVVNCKEIKLQKNDGVIERQIAYKNLKRNKRKYKSITTSICIIIILIFLLSNITQYITKAVVELYPTNYNIQISAICDGEFAIDACRYFDTLKCIDRIKHLDDIMNYSILVRLYANIEKDKNILTPEVYEMDRDAKVTVIACEGKVFNQYLENLGLEYKDAVSSCIFIDNYNESKMTTLQEGDKLPININGKKCNIPIIKMTDLDPSMALGTLDVTRCMKRTSPAIIVSTDMIRQEEFQKTSRDIAKDITMYINSNNPNQLEKDIARFIDSNLMVFVNYAGQQEKNESMMFLVNTFLYGLLIIVTVIGISNIYNTVTASMNLRKREFELLSAIGMTKKQANKMLYFECFLYTAKALIIGVILGLVLNYLLYLYLVYVKNSSTLEYYIPVWQIMVLGIGVFVTLAIIMKRTWKKLQRSQTN